MDAQIELNPHDVCDRAAEPEVERLIATLPTRDRAMKPGPLRTVAGAFRSVRPGLSVEFGSGTSTAVLAMLCRLYGGRVVSVEESARFARRTEDLLAELGLSDHATILHAPVRRVEIGEWRGRSYRLSADALDGAMAGGRAAFVLIDGPASAWRLRGDCRYGTLPRLRGRVDEGAAVLLDDAERPRETRLMHRWEREGLVRFHRVVANGTSLAMGQATPAMRVR